MSMVNLSLPNPTRRTESPNVTRQSLRNLQTPDALPKPSTKKQRNRRNSKKERLRPPGKPRQVQNSKSSAVYQIAMTANDSPTKTKSAAAVSKQVANRKRHRSSTKSLLTQMEYHKRKADEYKKLYAMHSIAYQAVGSLVHQLPFIEEYASRDDFLHFWTIILAGVLRVVSNGGVKFPDEAFLRPDDVEYLKQLDAQFTTQFKHISLSSNAKIVDFPKTRKMGPPAPKRSRLDSPPVLELEQFLSRTKAELLELFPPAEDVNDQTLVHFTQRFQPSDQLVKKSVGFQNRIYHRIFIRCVTNPEIHTRTK